MKILLIKIGIFAVIISAFLFIISINKRLIIENQNISDNLHQYDTRYKTDSSGWALQSSALEVELKDLRKVNRKMFTDLSDYDKKIKIAYKTIQDMDKKLKHVESVNTLLLQATGNDTIIYNISKIDTMYVVSISDFDDGYLKAVFSPINDIELEVSYKYQDNINVIVTKEKDPQDKRFFLLRWLKPKYKSYSTATTGNPKSEIKINDFIIIK